MESYKYLVDSKKLEKKKQETTEKSKMIGLILNLPIIVLKCKQSKYAIEEVEIFRQDKKARNKNMMPKGTKLQI